MAQKSPVDVKNSEAQRMASEDRRSSMVVAVVFMWTVNTRRSHLPCAVAVSVCFFKRMNLDGRASLLVDDTYVFKDELL